MTKGKSGDIIKENPYIITNDLEEITFKKIDRLRNNFNILDNDINRVQAGIKYVFNEVNNSLGNTYLEKEEVIYYAKKVLNVFDEDLIIDCLNRLILELEVILYDDKYFISKMYEAENYIAKRLYSLSDYKHVEIDELTIKNLEEHFSIEFNDDQKRAIISSLIHNFLVITGGPGTGKTTIIKAICKLYQDMNDFDDKSLIENLALLAPTGRASKRISEQTNLPSKTIHRFLKWDKESNTFSINEDNPSDVKLVIIDESSMIDTYLFYNLLLGLKPNTKIIMIGDYNQLPSVGPGQVLKDILDSDILPFIKLEKLYRQHENSNITLLAHSINNNDIDYSLFNKDEDLTFIETQPSKLKDFLKEFVLTYKDLDFNKFQVMAPIYKGDNGIDNLNYFMQEVINDEEKNTLLHEGVNFKENDKVLQLVNEPDLNIFNGDIGKIIRINNKPTKEMYIDFDGNIVRYTSSMVSNIKLGYAISIHKAQGSEFDVVIIPITNAYSNMLYKKLIYTAVTRAKKKLILIGEFSAFKKAVLNNRENTRKTFLKKFLELCIEKK